jgi:hypothetical protein
MNIEDLKRLKFGFEIELEYNRQNSELKSFSIGDYHHGTALGRYWKVESDGSLSSEKFSAGRTCEFVLRRPLGLRTYMKALEEFKSFFGNAELNKTICFNSTTGAHIHFSFGEKMMFQRFKRNLPGISTSTMYKLLNNNMVKSKLPSSVQFRMIKSYYRSYSERFVSRTTRYQEINYNKRQTLEWRSFNLRGVETWEQFFEAYRVAVLSIVQFLEWMLQTKCEFKTEITGTENWEFRDYDREQFIYTFPEGDDEFIYVDEEEFDTTNEILIHEVD